MIPVHAIALTQPRMPHEQYVGFKVDIAERGLVETITLYHGQVLDGRERQRACVELGLEPRYDTREFPTDDAARAWLTSRNDKRRHAKAEQRAASWLMAEANADTLADLEREAGDRMHSGKAGKEPTVDSRVAFLVGCSRGTVQRVRRVARMSRELLRLVASGEMTCGQVFKLDTKRNRAAGGLWEYMRERDKFDVLYVDPPWNYDDSAGIADNAGWLPQLHFPTLSNEELCGMDAGQYAAEDAVLFLWSVSFKLADALALARAWGFTYRTSWVWHKTKIGTGRGIGLGGWLMVQHETLLICTRGKMTPGVSTVPPSVHTAPVDGYNRKPTWFRDQIARMFPDPHRRAELFAREQSDGWQSWGNDVPVPLHFPLQATEQQPRRRKRWKS